MAEVALITLGCKVNQSETQSMTEAFQRAGYTVVGSKERADIYVINTCSVTSMSESKGRQLISRLHRQNPDAVIAVTGCYAQRDPDGVAALEGVSVVVGTNHKSRMVDICAGYIKDRQSKRLVTDTAEHKDYEDMPLSRHEGHTRAYMKIQDGCQSFCSYCIIPYLRGPVRSRSLESIVAEAERLAENGFCEIVLGGIHLTSYGDCDSDLGDVVMALQGIEKIKRIRLGSLEPMGITDAFLEKVKACDKLCDHFHLSLQSGCDSVLERMNRKYTTEEYLDVCRRLRERYPNCAISTDIIVGFPGETEEELEATCAFVKRVGFAFVHVFPYSRRKGTRAAEMPDQVAPQVKKARAARLSKICAELKNAYISRFLGCEVEVLAERSANGITRGLTKNHLEIRTRGEVEAGRLITVRTEKMAENCLEGSKAG
ncbi:MAG: tRNA (N(6)-L-threonylcarbamoyladenosine(37)-C(2))-methylthiotransferase MtaB [Clostridia bacterium]|nr:tRNA (N(6)-L-threonylcarbamoyladenosine(37)-C(2))-methylthiotransferase MtaB [Clostridia bacterium]